MRLPKQVIVIPYKIENEEIKYCIFKRRKMQIWQWIAGGVEDFDNDILAAAKRESLEEANISNKAEFIQLEAFCRIPVVNVCKTFKWGEHVFYSDEYAFAVNVKNENINISDEHSEYKWVTYNEAKDMLKYDSNKSALWELNEKLSRIYDKCK